MPVLAVPIRLELYSKNLMNGISKTVAIMKKRMNIFVLVATAAMALASCQKNEIDGLVKQEAHFTINAGIAETKTLITDNGDGTYTPSWTGDEQLGVLFSAPNKDTEAGDVVSFENTSDAGKTASFQGSTTVTENGTFYSFYPASVFNRGYGEGDARLDLKSVQNPSATSFDPSCDILVAKPYEYEVVDGQVVVNELYFKRLMSVLRIDLNTDFEDVKNEFVESVSFTAGDVKIVGYARVFLDNPDFTTQKWASSGDEYCTVTARYETDVVSVAGTDNSVYLVIAPVTIPEGKELTFEIKTKNYTISKTVTVPSEMKFAAGNVNKINLTIKEDNCTAKAEDTSDFSGTYAILAKRTSGEYYYMTNDLGTASTKRFTAETAGDALPEVGVTLGASKLWEVSKSGVYYTVQSVGAGKYITWTSGNSANLGDEGIEFTIEKSDDGTYQLSYIASDATRYLSLNGTSGNDYFALYKSGQAMDLSLIPAELGEEPSTLTATAPEQMSAEGGDGSFSYTLTNPKDGVELTVTEDAEWITNAVAAEGTVTYTVAANESEDPREAVITLTYGDLTETVSVSQAGKPAEGEASEAWTLVTDASTLAVGNKIVIVASNSDYAMGADKGNNRNAASISKSGNSVIINDEVQIITLETGNVSNTFAFNTGAGYLYAASSGSNYLKTKTKLDNNGSWTITITPDGVATIKSQGTYTRNWIRKNSSSALFACYASGQDDVSIYKLVGAGDDGEGGDTSEPVLQDRNLSFSVTTVRATVGDDFTEPTLSGVTNGVTYSSSTTSVATVNETTGEVTLVAAGETTITATAVADATYKAGTVSYTLIVSAGSQGGDSPKTWKLVTDASTLNAGDIIRLGCSTKSTAAGAMGSNKYFASVPATYSNDAMTSDSAIDITLGGKSGSWTLTTSEGTIGTSAAKTLKLDSGTTTWTIEIESGVATIKSTNTSYGWIQYNASNPRFLNYASSQTAIQIYRYE